MRKIKFECFFFLMICMLSTACDFFSCHKKEKETEPEYNANELWRIKLGDIQHVNSVIEDNYFYTFNGETEDVNERRFKVLKINLKNPSDIIVSQEFQGTESTHLLIVEEKLIFFTQSSQIIILNKNDLSVIKKQYIGYPRIYDKVCEYKGNLYWANFREYSENENGERIYARKNIIRANLQEIIDFTGNIFPIEYLCDEFNGERVVSLYIENGVLYFLTFNRDWWKENDEKSYLIAWDLDLNKKIWVNEISKEMFLSEGDFKIAEGKIYLIGNYGRYCYDMITGKKEWSRVQNDEDRFKEIIIHTADLSKDMLFYDEKIYFTNEESFMSGKASGHPKENYKNILCISAKDGSYVWGDMIHFGISNFIVPCEYNNKIYFSTEKGLRVYEAQKGKLIGVDKEYNCSGQDPMYKYNDILLFFVNQYDHIDLVAMKAE